MPRASGAGCDDFVYWGNSGADRIRLTSTFISRFGCTMVTLILNGATSYARLYQGQYCSVGRYPSHERRRSLLRPNQKHKILRAQGCRDDLLSTGKTHIHTSLSKGKQTYPRENHDMARFPLTHARQCSFDHVDWTEEIGLNLVSNQCQGSLGGCQLFNCPNNGYYK